MNYNNQYNHLTVILNYLNLSLIHRIVHMLLYDTFRNGFYKDNRMVTTNNITSRMCSVNVE